MKRFFDVVVSLILLVGLSIPLLLIAWRVAGVMGRPVLFRQLRPGLNAKPFEMIKFRTMRPDTTGVIDSRLDEARLTPFGRFLRGTSLDELPELWNVLRGDMSLVGPRPLLMEYLPLYSTEQMRRHDVRPGITGWAQVNGRNAISWEEKFGYDAWYVKHNSFLFDLRILILTAIKVFRREGIGAAGHATMPAFLGNKAETKTEDL